MDFTCVEIKNVKYVKLIDLDRKREKELDLTTIHRDQELAYLNVYYVDDNKKKQLLKSIQVNNIRPGRSGIPELHLIVNYDGKRFYKIIVKLNGYIYHNSVVDIRMFRKKSLKVPPWLLAAAAVVLAAGLLYFPLRNLLSSDNIMPSGTRDISSVQTGSSSEDKTSDTAGHDSSERETEKPDETAEPADTTEPAESEKEQTAESTESEDQGTPVEQEEAVEAADSSVPAETATTEDPLITPLDTQPEMTEAEESDSQEKPPAQLIDDEAVVYFFPNSSVLTSDTKAVLNEIVNILNRNGNLDVEIIGHCAFFGTEKGRQEISEDRARNVYEYFISLGWQPESTPVLEGKGHLEIVTRDPQKQNLNRRVEIRIKSR